MRQKYKNILLMMFLLSFVSKSIRFCICCSDVFEVIQLHSDVPSIEFLLILKSDVQNIKLNLHSIKLRVDTVLNSLLDSTTSKEKHKSISLQTEKVSCNKKTSQYVIDKLISDGKEGNEKKQLIEANKTNLFVLSFEVNKEYVVDAIKKETDDKEYSVAFSQLHYQLECVFNCEIDIQKTSLKDKYFYIFPISVTTALEQANILLSGEDHNMIDVNITCNKQDSVNTYSKPPVSTDISDPPSPPDDKKPPKKGNTLIKIIGSVIIALLVLLFIIYLYFLIKRVYFTRQEIDIVH